VELSTDNEFQLAKGEQSQFVISVTWSGVACSVQVRRKRWIVQ